MCPIIFQAGPVTVYSYGMMLAIAVVTCAFLIRRDARRHGFDPDDMFDFVFWVVVGGIVGCRLFFILLNWEFFRANPSQILMLQNGGLAWQGGLVLGVVTAVIYIRIKKMPLLGTLDLIAPYVALGQAIGRIGCFLNGCCYGQPWARGIYFPVHDAHLHPTQLYSTAGLLLIFVLLKRLRARQSYPGQIIALYFMLSTLWRFVVEFFRADHVVVYAGLSIFQLVCITLFIAALYANAFLQRR